MANEDGRVRREAADLLDEEGRCLAAITAGYSCICADAAAIRAADPGPARSQLLDALYNRLRAFQLLLAAFEPLAKTWAEEHGNSVLRSRVDELIAETAATARATRIDAVVERAMTEFFAADSTNGLSLIALERRMVAVEPDALALEREGNGGPRIRLFLALGKLRAKMHAEDPSPTAAWRTVGLRQPVTTRPVAMTPLTKVSAPVQPTVTGAVQPGAGAPRPAQQAVDPDEAAKLRAIQQAIDADNRATNMKIFEIQRKAQEDAFKSMDAIHDKQNEMKF
jgi:hypothetical protein